jgi:phosphotransferase system  glucose/maltose/N-acetylglucosamine-specific IIC component
VEKTGPMNLKTQNQLLTVLCVILLMAVLALMVWLWFGEQIEHVDYQLKSLQN